MADITFDCPECASPLEVDEAGAGKSVACPQCSKKIQIPSGAPVSAPQSVPVQQYKPCKFCGEQIMATAIKCKHCGEFLQNERSPTACAPATQKEEAIVKTTEALKSIGKVVDTVARSQAGKVGQFLTNLSQAKVVGPQATTQQPLHQTLSSRTGVFAKLDASGDKIYQMISLDHRNKLTWAYRASLILALLSTFMPWVSFSASMSFMGNISASSLKIDGTSTIWGQIVFVLALGGIGLSFINPANLLSFRVRAVMSGVGLSVLVCGLLVMFRASSYVPGGNYSDTYGNSAQLGTHAALGLYLAFIGGCLSSITGLANQWQSNIPPASEQNTGA